MANRNVQLVKAARNLQSILEEIGKHTKPTVIEEPTTRGKWTTTTLLNEDWTSDHSEQKLMGWITVDNHQKDVRGQI